MLSGDNSQLIASNVVRLRSSAALALSLPWHSTIGYDIPEYDALNLISRTVLEDSRCLEAELIPRKEDAHSTSGQHWLLINPRPRACLLGLAVVVRIPYISGAPPALSPFCFLGEVWHLGRACLRRRRSGLEDGDEGC